MTVIWTDKNGAFHEIKRFDYADQAEACRLRSIDVGFRNAKVVIDLELEALKTGGSSE